jgi:BirA family transcriptional regulator, biotin operon repressor / biotin---[acetyl-CoA-carboxylase] ligase
MDVLHARALEGAPAGTAVVAAEQTGGRGSRGNSWVSPVGGLWLSVLLRPERSSGLDLLSLRAGLAVSEALSSMEPGPPIEIRWPNDLMLGERKVGGILCEARWQGDALGWVVVGLGLNVNNPAPESLGEAAGNLADRLPGRSAGEMAEPLADVIRRIETGASALAAEEVERFRALDWLRGRSVRAPAGGVADGIAADGALLVRLGDGRLVTLRAGPVELAGASLRT